MSALTTPIRSLFNMVDKKFGQIMYSLRKQREEMGHFAVEALKKGRNPGVIKSMDRKRIIDLDDVMHKKKLFRHDQPQINILQNYRPMDMPKGKRDMRVKIDKYAINLQKSPIDDGHFLHPQFQNEVWSNKKLRTMKHLRDSGLKSGQEKELLFRQRYSDHVENAKISTRTLRMKETPDLPTLGTSYKLMDSIPETLNMKTSTILNQNITNQMIPSTKMGQFKLIANAMNDTKTRSWIMRNQAKKAARMVVRTEPINHMLM